LAVWGIALFAIAASLRRKAPSPNATKPHQDAQQSAEPGAPWDRRHASVQGLTRVA
jgi:hypothetical protein